MTEASLSGPAGPADPPGDGPAAGPTGQRSSPGQAAFDVRDLSVEFPGKSESRVILDRLNFQVRPGEFVSLVGASGTGKTTILRALGGLQPTVRGSTILFNGRPVTGPPDGAVIVFQDYFSSLLPWRTVAQNVRLGIERTLDKPARHGRVQEALRLVGLADRSADYPAQLSGGMQQRVQIARALAMQPAVMLMDEPFGALDALTKAALQDELMRLHSLTGMTIIFVTHDIEEAVYLSDRVLVLNGPPARVSEEVPIALARPRNQLATKELPEYLEYRHHLYKAISVRGDGS
jgi:NitT/TauT family transport system ATP-binding protein